MTDTVPRLLKSFAAVACCSIFVAASCESKKPVPPTATHGQQGATNNTEQVAKGETIAPGTIQPRDVGPKAPAIFMMSSLKGYTEPCGCTLDVMLGGLDRIAGTIAAARPLYESVTIIDGGDLFFETKTLEEHEIPQEKAKVDLVARALKEIGVQITVPGENDFALGIDYYFARLHDAGITAIAANLKVEGRDLAPTWDGDGRLYVGIVDPSLYAEIDGVTASDPAAALKALRTQIDAADVTVLIVHGEVPFAKQMLEDEPGADFAHVGHAPRETDQVDQVANGFTLEPYDQGRYLGILKLYNTEGAAASTFVDARPTSKAELQKVERQIDHVNDSINKIPPAATGEEPPMLLTLRKRLNDLQARRTEIKNADINVPEDRPAFLWRSIPFEPGLPIDAGLEKARAAYNVELKKLNSAIDREVPPAPAGTAEFIGTDNCTSCHAAAKTFYDGTAHATAWATLVERDKDFDQKCVGCHVVGYEQPGGSVIGKWEYDAEIEVVGAKTTLRKNLVNVGCESCHGPGSLHVGAPVDVNGTPQHIIADPTVEQCNQCHVPEHSPRFVYDVYVDEITGEGHARSTE